MKNRRFQHLGVFLAVLACVGLLSVPAAASSVITDSASVAAWNNWINVNHLPIVTDVDAQKYLWEDMDLLVSYAGPVACDSYGVLAGKVQTMNSCSRSLFTKAAVFLLMFLRQTLLPQISLSNMMMYLNFIVRIVEKRLFG